jgi:chemotaxis protein MotB
MAANNEQPVIIIRRKKGGGHGGHHGGAWKVAYADFVTAMMSFFLLLWILNTTTSDQRKGLAEYFAPAGISESHGGAGGVMGGLSPTTDHGANLSDTSPPGVDDRTLPSQGLGEEGDEDTPGKSKNTGEGSGASGALKDAAAAAAALQREEEGFQKAEEVLKKAISDSPEFSDLAQQILIDRTPEGLRIQIVDRDKFSMFPSGNSIPYERGRDLLRLVGKVIARLPNHISISGHTDSAPFLAGGRHDNWGLSCDRANVSRGELVYAGVDPNRVERVVGQADKDPLYPKNPNDPKNRRISIVLLRESSSSPKPPPAPPAAAQGAAPTTPSIPVKVMPPKP